HLHEAVVHVRIDLVVVDRRALLDLLDVDALEPAGARFVAVQRVVGDRCRHAALAREGMHELSGSPRGLSIGGERCAPYDATHNDIGDNSVTQSHITTSKPESSGVA